MSLSDINLRERKFHNELHSSGKEREQNKFYKALYNLNRDFLYLLRINTKSVNVLDYGCGSGNFAKEVKNFDPKKITAIDISEEAIKKAKQKQENNDEIINFKVDNCEKLDLESNTFDVAYGSGILHHLSLDKSLNELNRVLKKNGVIIFAEPLATNPIINIYRKFTPHARSEDEHPFKLNDIKLIESMFKNVEIKYYGFFTLVFLPFYKSPQNSKFFKILSFLDEMTFKIKYFKFLAWSILIKAEKN